MSQIYSGILGTTLGCLMAKYYDVVEVVISDHLPAFQPVHCDSVTVRGCWTVRGNKQYLSLSINLFPILCWLLGGEVRGGNEVFVV